LYKATNRLKEAEPMYKRALEIWEKSLGKDHPQVATALNNLALLYQATNRLKEAEPPMQRVVEILGHLHTSRTSIKYPVCTVKTTVPCYRIEVDNVIIRV